MEAAVEACPRPTSVVERDRARTLEGTGRRDPQEHALDGAAGERRPDGVVLLGGEQQRQRRRPLAQVGAGDLAGLDRVARAVEDVVREQIFHAAGAVTETEQKIEQLVRFVRDAGRIPVQRDTLYQEIRRW